MIRGNLSEIFKTCSQLPIVALVTGGRTGSDFFQSLTDGHPEILQLTGICWFHDDFWEKAVCKSSLNDLVNELIYRDWMISKFKSLYNVQERWDKLGKKKNESFCVSISKFKRTIIKILENQEINSKNVFIACHMAYSIARGESLREKKLLFVHIHHIRRLPFLINDFNDAKVIFTTRDPRNNWISGLEHHRDYSGAYGAAHVYSWLSRVYCEATPICKLVSVEKIKLVVLEDLHLKSKEVLTEFCDDFSLNFEECLLESTYHDKQWWGDALSKKYLEGFNKNIRNPKWFDKMFFYENYTFEFLFRSRFERYGYDFYSRTYRLGFIGYFIIPFFIILPLKYELDAFGYDLSKAKRVKGKVKSIAKSIIFYLLRILLQFKWLLIKLMDSEKKLRKYIQ